MFKTHGKAYGRQSIIFITLNSQIHCIVSVSFMFLLSRRAQGTMCFHGSQVLVDGLGPEVMTRGVED